MDNVQTLAEDLLGLDEVGFVGRVLFALVNDADGANALKGWQVLCQRGDGSSTVNRPVVGTNDQVSRNIALDSRLGHNIADIGNLCACVLGVEAQVNGTAIGEAVQRNGQAHLFICRARHRRVLTGPVAVGIRAARCPGVLQAEVAPNIFGVGQHTRGTDHARTDFDLLN